MTRHQQDSGVYVRSLSARGVSVSRVRTVSFGEERPRSAASGEVASRFIVDDAFDLGDETGYLPMEILQ